MRIDAEKLRDLAKQIFTAAGCNEPEAGRISNYLVAANLVGHDSHGVIRIPVYIDWLREGSVVANQTIDIVFENDSIAVTEGRSGFGQSIGEQAVHLGIDKCKRQGVSAIALRRSGHLGRVGDWSETAAAAGLFSVHFVNSSGKGRLVAPYGGIDRRLSANPISAGVPIAGRDPIILDISSCMIAEGKIKVALNQGVELPEGCVIDRDGNPCNEPKTFYADPGAILPFGGHKGYGLGIIVELLAGALTGAGCTNPEDAERMHQGMLSVYLDPKQFGDNDSMQTEIARFVEYVKSSRAVTPDGEVLMPGEIESRRRAERLEHGIELDDLTWSQLSETAASLGVAAP